MVFFLPGEERDGALALRNDKGQVVFSLQTLHMNRWPVGSCS